MLTAAKFLDRFVKMTLTAFCAVLLLLMVVFTVYTVVMRYVFENPPVWGDLLTVLSNIWLVFFALALTVRDKDHIALDLIYSWLPLKVAFAIQQFWTVVIFFLGLVMIVLGAGSCRNDGREILGNVVLRLGRWRHRVQTELHAQEIRRRHCANLGLSGQCGSHRFDPRRQFPVEGGLLSDSHGHGCA